MRLRLVDDDDDVAGLFGEGACGSGSKPFLKLPAQSQPKEVISEVDEAQMCALVWGRSGRPS